MGHEDIDKIATLIKRISAKYTILMVEHNLNVVADLSDIITVLTRGHVLAEAIMPTFPKTSVSRKPIWGRVMPDLKMANAATTKSAAASGSATPVLSVQNSKPGTASRTSFTASTSM